MRRGEVARQLGMSEAALDALLAERVPVTAELACRLGQLSGLPADDWFEMQRRHDDWEAARRTKKTPPDNLPTGP